MPSFVDWYIHNPPIDTVKTMNTSNHGDMYNVPYSHNTDDMCAD